MLCEVVADLGISSESLSRLKGIETNSAKAMVLMLFGSESLSRLKGIETQYPGL